jgi:hypothetical protein
LRRGITLLRSLAHLLEVLPWMPVILCHCSFVPPFCACGNG